MRETMTHFVSYDLLPIVFNMSLTASVVIVFVLLVRLVLKKAPKVYSYALWAVVLFRLLCPVSITSDISLLALTDPPVLETTTQTNYVAYVSPNIVHTEYPEVQLPVPGVNDAINEMLPQGQEQLVADPLEFPVALATVIWLFGILVLLVYSVISLILLSRRLVSSMPLWDNIYLADHIDTPFVIGVLRPKIYLPSTLSEREQEYIILHEQYHIRRFDHIAKMLAFVALCIHWFNPLVWLAFVLSGKDMEMSCDEAVLKKMGEHVRADYSASLLSLATGRRIIAGTPLAFGEGDTKDRIKNLLNWKKPKVWLTISAVFLCVLVIAACGANPKEDKEPSVSGLAGRFASAEDYAVSVMELEKEIHYYTTSGEMKTAKISERKLDLLNKLCELEDLAPDGVLEAWEFHHSIQLDVNPEEIVLVGGQSEQGGWYDLEGQGGHILIALRYEDGSYDILDDQFLNDGMDFYGYHNSWEEALYDWYVQEYGLDIPMEVIDLLPTLEDAGNHPAHRFVGDGWYIYEPISGWNHIVNDGEHWTSQYGTGSVLSVVEYSEGVDDMLAIYRGYGWTVFEQERFVQYESPEGVCVNIFLHEKEGRGGYQVIFRYNKYETANHYYLAFEPMILQAMAESFTVERQQEENDNSKSAIEGVTVITPEDPNAEYGVVESGTLSNGIEYWIINPTPTERVRMDLLSDSETFNVWSPIVNATGDNGANVGDAIGVYPDEYVYVRVGGLPSTMPTVNVGCHYVDDDNADWYPTVGADALVVFKIGSPSSDVQITTSTCESTAVTTSFTISTSTTNPAEVLVSDGFEEDGQVVPQNTTFGVDSNILQIGGPILQYYQQIFSGESVYWGVDQPDVPKNGDHRLGPMTYVGEMDLNEKVGVVYRMCIDKCSVSEEKTEWAALEPTYLVVTYNVDNTFDQILGEVAVSSSEKTVKDIVQQVLKPHCQEEDKIGFLVSTTSFTERIGHEVRNCTHGAVGKLDVRYQYLTQVERRCSLCGDESPYVEDLWWGEWKCQ